MQTIICASCQQPVRIGSKYCHNCGAHIEGSFLSTQVERGRKKITGIIVAVLSASIIGRVFTFQSELITGGVSGEIIISSILSIGFMILLMVFLYKGYWWAKWLTGANLLIGALILCDLTLSIFRRFVAPIFLLILITQTLLYGIAGLALFRSEDVTVFLQEQEKRREGKYKSDMT